MALPIRQREGHREPENQELFISVDFGSTFAGSAFCVASDPTISRNRLKKGVIKSILGFTSVKEGRPSEAPTLIMYQPDAIIWGWRVYNAKSGSVIQRIKICLDDREITREERQRIEKGLPMKPDGERMTVDEVLADYLTQFLTHVKAQLAPVPFKYLAGDKARLIGTVPAIWTMPARRRTKAALEKAAQQAGIPLEGEVTLYSEPEAAFAYSYDKLGAQLELRVSDIDAYPYQCVEISHEQGRGHHCNR